MTRPPLPPFDEESARQKVKAAQDGWNTRDPEKVALAYTEDSAWRNRDEFFRGREAIKDFLRRKWDREQDYRLQKNLWCFTENRIAVRFEYESRDADGQWWRSHPYDRTATSPRPPAAGGSRRLAAGAVAPYRRRAGPRHAGALLSPGAIGPSKGRPAPPPRWAGSRRSSWRWPSRPSLHVFLPSGF